MTERLPSPAELLPARAAEPDGAHSDANGVVHKLLDLADRGDYIEAAVRAAELLQGSSSDVRLIAVYLAGVFVERGAPALPEVLAAVEKLGDPRSRRLDSALEWLFRAIVDRASFHTTRRDATWESWLRELSLAPVEDIVTRCDALSARHEKAAAALQKLGRWARDKLAPAVGRAKRAPPPEVAEPVVQPPEPAPKTSSDGYADPEPDDDDDAEPEYADEPEHDDEFDDDAPARHDVRFEPHGSRAVVIDSPALAELRDKLLAFEIVLARGELEKAAVVAHDVQAILASFDPVVYLPALFGRYSELLHGAFSDLEARWSDAGSPRWRILVQFYRTNLAGFVGE